MQPRMRCLDAGLRRGRGMLLTCALALSLLGSAPAAEVAAADPDQPSARPNILFAFADDWGRYAGAYARLQPGGPSDLLQTPHIDRVAREGVLFTNAFVNAPSCTPCRSSLLSGQYFWRTGLGAILQGAVWDDSIPAYPLLLRDAGYHIGHTYKVWSPGTPVNAPYGGAKYAYTRRGGHLNSYSQFVSAAEDQAAAHRQVLDEVRGNFQDFLEGQGDRPFCYWFGPTNTHRKWVQGSGRALWGLDPDALEGKLPPYLPDVPIVREDFCDYLGEVQAFDAALGVLLEELQRRDMLNNTLIVVSGDHGIPGFPRGKCNLYDLGVGVALAVRWGDRVPAGRVLEDFVNLPDLAPTFLEAAGLQPPAVMTARSLVPVLTSTGSGQIDPTRDAVIVGRERHVAAARSEGLPYPQRALRTKGFLYIRNFAPQRWPMGVGPGWGLPAGDWPSYEQLRENTFAAFADMDAGPTKAWIAEHRDQAGMEPYLQAAFGRRPAEELYDLRKDPHHMTNVADDPAYAEQRRQLADRLLTTLRDTGDPRVAGTGDTFDRPPYAGELPPAPPKPAAEKPAAKKPAARKPAAKKLAAKEPAKSEAAAAAGQWPNWRGPQYDGTSRETGLPLTWSEDSGLVWRCPLPEWGNSTPVIWDGSIFLTSHVDDQRLLLLRIDQADGQIVWTREVGSGSTPREVPGTGGQGARGRQKFHLTQNLASPSCVTDGQVVVAHFGNGDLAAYDFAGQRLWHRNLQEDHGRYTIWWGHANSPVLHGDLVISVCMQDSLIDLGQPPAASYLVAHHKRTGEQVWFTERMTEARSEPCDAYSTPVFRHVGEAVEMIVFGGLVLDAYDPASGQRRWQRSGLQGNRVIPSPVVADDLVFVTQGMRNPLLAVRPGDAGPQSPAEAVWTFDRGTSDSATPVVWQDLLFFVTNDGFATCLDAKSGERLWRERLPGQYRASPLAADGRIYFVNVDGLTTVVAASPEFQRLAENRLPDEILASPVVSRGRLFLRGRTALYCVGR